MSITEIGRVSADIDTGLGARTFGCEETRGSVDVDHFPHGHAEALDGRGGRLHIGLGIFGGCKSVR